MSGFEKQTDGTSPNTFKQILCRATNCPHNAKEKPVCQLAGGLELDESGICIFSDFWE
uniref:Uncharacterized protein n=1 Tax=viral metagenome TaxID=1070528 RepID=A0A6M3LRV1_9ZZZZ